MASVSRIAGNAIINPVVQLMTDIINKEDNCQTLQTDSLKRMDSLLQDIASLFRDQQEAPPEIVKIWLQLLRNSLLEAERLLSIDRSRQRQSCVDCLVGQPRRFSKQVRAWNAFFDELYHCFQSDLSILVTSPQFVLSKPLHKYEALRRDEEVKEPTVIQSPSTDESWMLFCSVAFKGDQVSMDIRDRARKIVDACRGRPLAINVVAAAMIGQSSVHEWDICLYSIQNIVTAESGLDAELYAALRFCYDALPNSDVKKCFLYCAIYKEDQEIDTLELVHIWIGEGLVKSKQETYVMDMAIGCKYLQLLVDRCLFQSLEDSTNVFKQKTKRVESLKDSTNVLKQKTIRVESLIRAMAIYIGQKEENCLFMATQSQRNFPEVHDENCRSISVANNLMEDLPTHLQCPKLASLTLRDNQELKEIPSEFVASLTSLRVLILSGCNKITSVPTSIEQLKMLEFLSLRDLPIEDLPKEVCRLSKLQFLDLSNCRRLKSLSSEIGEIKNLKCLNLEGCDKLKMIPREISELTSLSRLVLPFTMGLSMETEAPASIWSLKGLKNMMELRLQIAYWQQLKDGIMGSWSEMRHLMLIYWEHGDLPEEMKSMKKLQSFMLQSYSGYHCLPNCKFEHLEVVSLYRCDNISDLSPLEWMPNLKLLELIICKSLVELGIGSCGSGYQRLEKLVLDWLPELESLGGASKRGVWDERTLPHLCVLNIRDCPSLKRFPIGMEKLPNLCAIRGGSAAWWSSITWEDDDMKIKLQNIFKPY